MQHDSFQHELAELRREHYRIAMDVAALRVMLQAELVVDAFIKAGFKPSQPRVPRGQTGGGRWVDGGGGESVLSPRLHPPHKPKTPHPDAIDSTYPIEGAIALAIGGELAAGARTAYGLYQLRAQNNHYAQRIVDHAYEKHVLKQGEFPYITTRSQFKNHIEKILNKPDAIKKLDRGRTAYWDNETRTLVIKNTKHPHSSTALKPENGKKIF